jgi:hypothetical protein
MTYFVGCDLGPGPTSPTGVAIIRKVMAKDEEDGKRYQQFNLVHLERITGQTFREIAGTLKAIMADKRLVEMLYDSYRLQPFPRYPQLVVDFMATGPPVLREFRSQGLLPEAVAIYGGEQKYRGDNGLLYLPRRDQMSSLQLALQGEMFKIADGLQYYDEFLKEAENYQLKPVPPSQEFSVWREGNYDDLLFAVAIAGWLASREPARMWAIDPWSDGPPRPVFGPPPEVEV